VWQARLLTKLIGAKPCQLRLASCIVLDAAPFAHLREAQQHMQKSFVTRVSGQYYRPQYLNWLNKWPLFTRRNRRVSLNWQTWDGGPYHVAQRQARYRELLLGLCHLERAFMGAQDRLEHSTQHEKPLAEFRALACREELDSALKLLPLQHIEAELSTMLFLIRSMPSRLLARFHDIHAAFHASLNDLITEISDLQRIYTLKCQISQGSHVAQFAFALHLKSTGIQQELKSQFLEDRLSRLQFKQQDGKIYNHLSPLLAKKMRASDNLKQRNLAIDALVTAVDKSPLQWTITGLSTSMDSVVTHMGLTRDVLYNATKFHTTSLDNEHSRNFRNKWFKSFRRLLDAWKYDVPGPARESGPLPLLVHDWAAIQAYKIRTRPDMVTDQEVKLGRDLYARRVNGIPGEGHRSTRDLKKKRLTKKDHARMSSRKKASNKWYKTRSTPL
jgi:hypothetical protein